MRLKLEALKGKCAGKSILALYFLKLIYNRNIKKNTFKFLTGNEPRIRREKYLCYCFGIFYDY